MSSSMVVTWRRYTAAEKKTYRARVLKRRRELDWCLENLIAPGHFWADGFGSRVPTARLNGDVL